MKNETKFLKTVVSLLLLVLAVFSVVNASYSFFTSSNSSEGEISMGEMDVSFRYTYFDERGLTVTMPIVKGMSVNMISSTPFIERGVPFTTKIFVQNKGYFDLNQLSIINRENSCDVYIRFWIEAYRVVEGVVEDDVDYGKYFVLTRPFLSGGDNVNFSKGTTKPSLSPYCYFFEKAIVPDKTVSLGWGSSNQFEMTLQDISATDPVPIELLGENIEVRISFEAVQRANKAFESVFNDDKGYYSSWT